MLLRVDNEVVDCEKAEFEQREGSPHPRLFQSHPGRQPDWRASFMNVQDGTFDQYFTWVVSTSTLNKQPYEQKGGRSGAWERGIGCVMI